MKRSPALATAFLILPFVVIVNLAFALLVDRFGYDDVLREPAPVILARFAAGGPSLILTWLAFAMGCLLFIPVAVLLGRVLHVERTSASAPIALIGVLSAVLQAVGLLRWVFVVPPLATAYTDAASSAATRDAAVVAFRVVHQYGGVVVGEFLGQIFLVAWTVGTAMAMWQHRGAMRWLGALGLLTVPLWVVGFSELFASVIPGVRVIESAPLAFMLWEAWLAAIAATLIVHAVKKPHAATPAPERAT
jgi:hypothetical protein